MTDDAAQDAFPVYHVLFAIDADDRDISASPICMLQNFSAGHNAHFNDALFGFALADYQFWRCRLVKCGRSIVQQIQRGWSALLVPVFGNLHVVARCPSGLHVLSLKI